jgi:crossover junction endodeoxyribonuclease RusA
VTIQLSIPYPPSANRLWVRARVGMRKSDAYTAWISEAAWSIKSQRPGKISGPYKISIHASRPDKRVRDLDNILKPISDALQVAGVIANDSDCEMLTARWVTGGGQGVMVMVMVMIDRAGVE